MQRQRSHLNVVQNEALSFCGKCSPETSGTMSKLYSFRLPESDDPDLFDLKSVNLAAYDLNFLQIFFIFFKLKAFKSYFCRFEIMI